MHFSLFLGQGVQRAAEDTKAIDLGIEQALYADRHGFAAIYSGEQHFNNYEPYGDGLMMSSFLAGQMTQAWVGLSVVPLVIHHPLLFVQRVNLLDQLTKGKSMVGISAGRPFQGATFHVAHLDAKERAELFEAKLAVVEQAFAHTEADRAIEFDTGREHGEMDGRIMPYSYRRTPNLAIATNTASKVAEAGRAGRFVHLGPFALEPAAALGRVYREAMQDGGFDEAHIARAMQWMIHTKMVLVADTDDEAWRIAEEAFAGPMMMPPWIRPTAEEEGKSLREIYAMDPGEPASHMGAPESVSAYLHRIGIFGSPESVAREVAAYGEAGLPHMHIRFAFGQAEDSVFNRSLELFATEVMPRVGAETIPGPELDDIRPEFQPAQES